MGFQSDLVDLAELGSLAMALQSLQAVVALQSPKVAKEVVEEAIVVVVQDFVE